MPAGSAWRLCFLLCGVLIFIGGPMHPGGTMEQMLGDPNWVPSHLLILAAFLAFTAGLVLLAKSVPGGPATAKWLRLALIGTALQTVEMAVHTAAAVDHANLVAGRATPVLMTHLALSIAIYPIFAFTVAGFIVATMRERSLGSKWIGWIGIAGVAAHGVAPPLVLLTELPWARLLFPMIVLFAVWSMIAAVLPQRAAAPAAAEAAA